MPSVFPVSLKYSSGSTRTSAPVGQFSSQEYAFLRAPGGIQWRVLAEVALDGHHLFRLTCRRWRRSGEAEHALQLGCQIDAAGSGIRGTIVIAS